MKRWLFMLVLICTGQAISAQYIYTIKADSVKITNTCDTAELIIENHSQNVPGFLFNKGRGRTEFRRGLLKISDSIYIVGGDTLKINPWLQGGNRFGTTGKFGTLDNYNIDFYTNNIHRGRWANNGNLIIGSTGDEGSKFQVRGAAGIALNPTLSREGDRIMIGGNINSGDGQNILIRTSSDYGATYKNILMEQDGNIGLGTSNTPAGWVVGNPVVRVHADGRLALVTPTIYFGRTAGAYNSSALVTSVSNVNEWQTGNENYPNGQNHYYFGTQLTGNYTGFKRAPLKIGGRELFFMAGAGDTTAIKIAENRNVMVGTETDNGYKLQVNGNSYFNGTQQIAGTSSGPNGFAHTNFNPTVTSTGTDWDYLSGMLFTPTLNFSANNQQGSGLYIAPTFNLNGASQHPDAISSALHVSSILGGIKVVQAASTPGTSGQPLFIEQNGTSNKEIIHNYRNKNLTTKPFIWNHDNRAVGNSGEIVPALRSTIANVEAGGGISFTMDRYYYGTEAAMEMKYETTPAGDTASTKNTSIAFKTMSSGTEYTSLYLNGNNAGLGTTTPTAQLHTTGTVRFAGLTNDNSQTRIVMSDVNGNLYYRDASSLALNETINSDLAVNGRISAQKMLITQTGRWPDYVFSKQYTLPSLLEVEHFIKQNSHLPGIPSAAEVEKKGIDVGNNQAALLQKIEELTLYIIKQEKTIQKQSDQINELLNLKQEMAELRALIKKK